MELTCELLDVPLPSSAAGAEVAANARTSPGSTSLRSSPTPLRQSLGIITLAWIFGSVWWTTTTGEPLTAFAQGLGASNFQFGLLTALPFLASLAALGGSLLAERTGLHKRVFLGALYIQRLLWLAIALVPIWVLNHGGPGAARRALTAFLWLAFAAYASGATGGPAWLTWMARLVPRRTNGKYFARRRQWGMLTGIPAAIAAGWWLDRHAGAGHSTALPSCCAILFGLSAIFGLADIHLFQYVPAERHPPRGGRELLEALRRPLRNAAFLRVSCFVGTLTFAVNFLGQFATLYMLERVGVTSLGAQMVLVVAPMMAQLLVLGAWGRAADRVGNERLLITAAAALVPVGAAWCFVTPARVWLAYALAGAGAALWTGVEVANLKLVLDASGAAGKGARGKAGLDSGGGSSYAAINNVIINLSGCAGGLAAGGIAQLLANWHWQPSPALKTFDFYDVLFIASGVFRLASLAAFAPLMRRAPRRAQPSRASLPVMSEVVLTLHPAADPLPQAA